MSPSPRPHRIALFGATEHAFSAYRHELSNLGDVKLVNDATTSAELALFDALLLEVFPPFGLALRRLARCRDGNPLLPVVVVGDSLGVNQATELISYGAADCFEPPAPEGLLAHKLRKAIESGAPLPLEGRLMATLFGLGEGDVQRPDQRRCFRAAVLPTYPAFAHFEAERGGVRVLLQDLSILTDGFPGGFVLTFDEDACGRLPLEAWHRGTRVATALELPEPRRLLVASALVARLEAAPPFARTRGMELACEYVLESPTDEPSLRQFWVESQRRLASKHQP